MILLAIKMHELFAQVLTNRDLSRAGDLFSIDDNSVVADLSEVLTKIQEIASSSDFIQNDNNQSVVEICITRVTSAIRYLFIVIFRKIAFLFFYSKISIFIFYYANYQF